MAEQGGQDGRSSWSDDVSLATAVVAVGVLALTTTASLQLYENPYDLPWWAYASVAAPGVLGAWLVVELLWRPSRRGVLGALLFRTIWLGGLFSLLSLPFYVVVGWAPAGEQVRRFPDGDATTRAEAIGDVVLAYGLLGWMAVMGAGVLTLLAVVMPVLAVARPAESAQLNGRDVGPGGHGRARLSGLSLSGCLLTGLLGISFIAFGAEESVSGSLVEAWRDVRAEPSSEHLFWEWVWLVGLALLPVSVALGAVVWWLQRPRSADGRGSADGRAAARPRVGR